MVLFVSTGIFVEICAPSKNISTSGFLFSIRIVSKNFIFEILLLEITILIGKRATCEKMVILKSDQESTLLISSNIFGVITQGPGSIDQKMSELFDFTLPSEHLKGLRHWITVL